jgi:hypothetical protein
MHRRTTSSDPIASRLAAALALALSVECCGTAAPPSPSQARVADATSPATSHPGDPLALTPIEGGGTETARDAPAAPPETHGRLCNRSLPARTFGDQRHHKNLGEVDRRLPAGRARRVWTREMKGGPVEDRLGRTLPSFVTREGALAWTESYDDALPIGARRWPGPSEQPEQWVVVVASGEGYAQREVRLAVVRLGAGGTVERVARTRHALTPSADWGLVPENFGPLCGDEVDDCIGSGEEFRVDALDFAPYQLSPSRRAFGVRTTSFDGYAGGGATFETLTLLLIDGEELVPVLDVPASVFKLLAGDWNPDLSRQHYTLVAELLVEVRPRPGSLADLFLHSSQARVGETFVWNATTQRYDCADGVSP